LNSDQLGRARDAYREVQARHDVCIFTGLGKLLKLPQDIVRINQTVMELQQLMNDMALMVEQDQNKINVIEKNATQVQDDTEKGFVPRLMGLNWIADINKLRWNYKGKTVCTESSSKAYYMLLDRGGHSSHHCLGGRLEGMYSWFCHLITSVDVPLSTVWA